VIITGVGPKKVDFDGFWLTRSPSTARNMAKNQIQKTIKRVTLMDTMALCIHTAIKVKIDTP